MSNKADNQETFALQAMFGREIPPVADAGFAKSVLGRVRRKIWKRRLTLLSASVIGLMIALPTIGQLFLALGNGLTGLAARAEESDALGQIGTLLTILPLRETAEIASQELTTISSQISTASWYFQNQMLIIAGLLAVISLAATRLLER